MVAVSQRTADSALRERMHSEAVTTATAAKIQNTASVIYSPFGSAGSQRVETAWVWDERRSRS